MSWRNMNHLFQADLGPISSADLLVLIHLSVRAGDKGFCWPGQKSIAEETRLSVRKVRDCTAKLERLGLISAEKREGNKRSKFYTIAGSAAGDTVARKTGLKANTGRSYQDGGTDYRKITAPGAARKNQGKEKERGETRNRGREEPLVKALMEPVFTREQMRDLHNLLGRGCR